MLSDNEAIILTLPQIKQPSLCTFFKVDSREPGTQFWNTSFLIVVNKTYFERGKLNEASVEHK